MLRSAAEFQEKLQAGAEECASEAAHVSWGAAPAQVLFRTVRYQPPAKQRQPAVVHINYHVSAWISWKKDKLTEELLRLGNFRASERTHLPCLCPRAVLEHTFDH